MLFSIQSNVFAGTTPTNPVIIQPQPHANCVWEKYPGFLHTPAVGEPICATQVMNFPYVKYCSIAGHDYCEGYTLSNHGTLIPMLDQLAVCKSYSTPFGIVNGIYTLDYHGILDYCVYY
jgi:hypothetical protein